MRYFVTGGAGFIRKHLKNRTSLLILILVLSFLLRLAFSFGTNFYTSYGDEWDTDGYGRIANNLLEGNGYVFEKDGNSVLIRGPVYPLLLSLIQLAFGSGLGYKMALLLIHSVLGAMLCISVFFIAEKLFDHRVGLLSAAAVAFHPLLIWYTGRVFGIPLFAFLLSVLIWLLLRAFERPTAGRFFAAGIILGVATLTHSTLLLFPLFILVGIWAHAHHQKRIQGTTAHTLGSSLRMALLTVLGMILIIAPWTVRNYMVSGEFVLVTAGGGYNFLMGNFFVEHRGSGDQNNKALMGEAAEQIAGILSEKGYDHPRFFNFTAAQDKFLNQVSRQRIKQNPLKFLNKIRKQLLPFWYLGASETKTRILTVLQLPVLLLAGLGVFFSYTRQKSCSLLVLTIAYFNLVYAAIHAQVKFSVPVVPYVLILAVYGLSEIISYFKKRHSKINLEGQLTHQPKNEFSQSLSEKITV
jgi:4-amino-4-deoxy-L-arabinose transferase-like glycosyltransferase